jgi:hypothetical protein
VSLIILSLIYDGIGYFIVLSGKCSPLVITAPLTFFLAANVLNLILYHTTDIETQVCRLSFGYTKEIYIDSLPFLVCRVSSASSGVKEFRLGMHH